ncbi:MAG: DNA-binding response regulator [Anaerolineales bacterium]|nr:response regulator transcription factor [Anaerolineae bacterium]PWB51793.1 MAG: DNA-binding response regulator [Anaerolineales bacterium]
MIKILLADDHAVVRKGIKQILSEAYPQAIFGEAQNFHELRDQINAEAWDILVLDLAMPEGNGIEMLKQIKQEHPSIPVLVLSIYPADQYALRTIRVGAAGYLNKESAPEELVEAFQKILSGGEYISAAVAEELVSYARRDSDQPLHKALSDREYQVLCLIASGKEIREIASELSLSPKTVSTYRARILLKMDMRTNAELTHYAIQNHLVMEDLA